MAILIEQCAAPAADGSNRTVKVVEPAGGDWVGRTLVTEKSLAFAPLLLTFVYQSDPRLAVADIPQW